MKKGNKMKNILKIFLLSFIFLCSCNEPKSIVKENEKSISVEIINNLEIGQQRIVYIDAIGNEFIDYAEKFMKTNSNIKIISCWGMELDLVELIPDIIY